MTTFRGTTPVTPRDHLTIPDLIYKKTDIYVKVGQTLHKTSQIILIINAILWGIKFTLSSLDINSDEIVPTWLTGLLGFVNAAIAIADYFYTYKDYIGLKDMLDEFNLDEFSYRQLSSEDGSRRELEKRLSIEKVVIYKYIARKNLFKVKAVTHGLP